MPTKLFLVCPFSFMENYIHRKFGNNIFFITSITAEANFRKIDYLETIIDFIRREKIDEIIIVNDTSCRFLNCVIKNENTLGSNAEKNLQDLFIDNYSSIIQYATILERVKKLAELNIMHQANEILENELFKQQIITNGIEVKGLITTKSENKIIQILPNKYELASIN